MRGAAEVIEQAALSPQRLAETLLALRDCPQRRAQMRAAGQAWAIPNAAERIVQLLEEVGQCTHPQASV